MKDKLEQLVWIETWGRRIAALHLTPIALVLINIIRPFGFLGSQALIMAQPLLTGITDDRFAQAVALLDDPEMLRHLEMYLEGASSQLVKFRAKACGSDRALGGQVYNKDSGRYQPDRRR